MNDAVRLHQLSADLGAALSARRLTLAAAESCTGGGIGFAVTQIAGSSGWFDRGFVTYSNEAKRQMLGVPASALRRHGAVSEAVARAMALGALAHSAAQVSVAVTGIAGPGGGTRAKPVGTVWFAWAWQRTRAHELTVIAERHRFSGDRAAVRTQSIVVALEGLLRLLATGRAVS
jgi:nicotinamide-nucleotide amidase